MNSGELLLLGFALAGSAWAFVSYWKTTQKQREMRRREQLGIRNAQSEQAKQSKIVLEICVVCERPTTPEVDVFDESSRTWWHRECWREAIR